MQTNYPWLSKTAQRPTTWEDTKKWLRLLFICAVLIGLVGQALDFFQHLPSQDERLEQQAAEHAQFLLQDPLFI